MIKKLVIRNYALIDALEIDFTKGFSVITGETGAGKSIILGALSLILGQRIDTKVVTDTSQKTIVEGTFDISSYQLQDFFQENELEYDDTDCIMRREIMPSGKSRAFINDSPVTVAIMKCLGDRLIDIHSQHQNLLLADSRFQLQLVDVLAHNEAEKKAYQQAYRNYLQLTHALEEMCARQDKERADEDYIRFQYNQLDEAHLVDGEQEELEAEQERLTHAGEIKERLCEITSLLEGEENGILDNLKAVFMRSNTLLNFFPEAESVAQRVESALIELKDLDATFVEWNDTLAIDPERLEWVERRLDTLYVLQQKHHVRSVAELINIREEFAKRLLSIDNSDNHIAQLQQEVEASRKMMLQCADILTATRVRQAPLMAERLTNAVRPLGMPHVQVAVDVESHSCGEMGAEQVVIRFSANKNQPLQPVAEIASGGEISRLMLCVKSLVADAIALPTIIFDEIDTGVSGDIASRMGYIMKEMSQYMQVIAITHLPQVAALGSTHYRVYKDNSGDSTRTYLTKLKAEQRIEEVARMLSGTTLTDAALNNARVLLDIQN